MKAIESLVVKLGLPKLQSDLIRDSFHLKEIEIELDKWSEESKKLVVTSEDQVPEMMRAKDLSKAASKIRINVEKTRVELKDKSLREGRLIDGIANLLKERIEPIERHLKDQASFADRMKAKRMEELIARRKSLLEAEGMGTGGLAFELMTEEEFGQLLDMARSARIERERKAENEKRLHDERTTLLNAEGVDTRYLPLGTMEETEFQNRLAAAKQAKIDKAESDRKAQEAKAESDRLKSEKAKADAEAKAKQNAERDLHICRFSELCESGFTSDDIGEGVHLGRMTEIDFDQFQIQITARRDEKLRLQRETEEAKAEQARLEAEILAKKQQEEAEAKAKAEEARKLAEGPEIDRIKAWLIEMNECLDSAPKLDESSRFFKGIWEAEIEIEKALNKLEDLCNA